MFYCEKCGSTDCCERCDIEGEPVLCDECYQTILNHEFPTDDDCDNCWFYNHRLEQCDKLGGCRYDN